MKKLASFQSRFKAEFLMTALDQAGIRAVEIDKKESITQSIGRLEIHVSEEEWEAASKILSDIQSQEDHSE